MNNYLQDPHTLRGTVGGTIMVLILQINGEQLLSTAILTATGALVSFCMSVLCRYLLKRFTDSRGNKP